jgi:hypothetical protein
MFYFRQHMRVAGCECGPVWCAAYDGPAPAKSPLLDVLCTVDPMKVVLSFHVDALPMSQ